MMYWYTSEASDLGWNSGTLVAICAIKVLALAIGIE